MFRMLLAACIVMTGTAAFTQSCGMSVTTSDVAKTTTYTYTVTCTGVTPTNAAPFSVTLAASQEPSIASSGIASIGYDSDKKVFNIQLNASPGSFQLSAPDDSTAPQNVNYVIAVAGTSTSSCTASSATCFLGSVPAPVASVNSDIFRMLVGVGSKVTGPHIPNYTVSPNNVLESQSPGRSTPSLLLGGGFQFYDPDLRGWDCRFPTGSENGHKCFNYFLPTSAFINVQFAPASNNVINGYTFCAGFSLVKNYLDFLIGYGVSSDDQPSPGFVRTAGSAVQNNPATYPTFNAKDIYAGKPGALDGFPLNTASGAPLYNGNPLVTTYHGGLFVGVGIPLNVMKLFNWSPSK